MKKLMKNLGFILVVFLFGCSQNPETTALSAENERLATSINAPQTELQAEIAERKLIKEGQIKFETSDISATRQIVFEAVKKCKAYISSDQESTFSGSRKNTLIICVPAKNFDNLLQEATLGVEKFMVKTIKIKDVTEEFIDIEARLRTKKELEKRYITLLNRANNVKEVLAVEQQIGQLQADIESIEGRLKYLQNKVSFSTLNMEIYETFPTKTTGFASKFTTGFKDGWERFILFFVMLTHIWPFIIIGIGLVASFKIYRKKKKTDRKQQKQ